ncbi:MAG: hypothetical protein N4A57_01540 [Anaeromicrobium sp.]|uniref:hypothetical protein n=1 Tax=Anaeromicrobium sp. TaxID=1929132 RepID=UPI0025F79550|nr:hypothetical protein [Anaeromicrobium sp.]MCT4592949.1 hypothetical protein [Anaeromicrobium sp.]
MARVKAIFDADILIHLVETNSIKYALDTLGCIYVSDYVYQYEIRKDTEEGRSIVKLKNNGEIKVLNYGGLTNQQKRLYRETYKLLKKEDLSDDPKDNPINEGERITAAFAKACNIYYYMSDDNKASSYIKSLAAVDIINFCDILFLHIWAFGKNKIVELKKSYESFIKIYGDHVPRILKNKGTVLTFEQVMARAYDKFHSNANLKRLIDNIKINVEKEIVMSVAENKR